MHGTKKHYKFAFVNYLSKQVKDELGFLDEPQSLDKVIHFAI